MGNDRYSMLLNIAQADQYYPAIFLKYPLATGVEQLSVAALLKTPVVQWDMTPPEGLSSAVIPEGFGKWFFYVVTVAGSWQNVSYSPGDVLFMIDDAGTVIHLNGAGGGGGGNWNTLAGRPAFLTQLGQMEVVSDSLIVMDGDGNPVMMPIANFLSGQGIPQLGEGGKLDVNLLDRNALLELIGDDSDAMTALQEHLSSIDTTIASYADSISNLQSQIQALNNEIGQGSTAVGDWSPTTGQLPMLLAPATVNGYGQAQIISPDLIVLGTNSVGTYGVAASSNSAVVGTELQWISVNPDMSAMAGSASYEFTVGFAIAGEDFGNPQNGGLYIGWRYNSTDGQGLVTVTGIGGNGSTTQVDPNWQPSMGFLLVLNGTSGECNIVTPNGNYSIFGAPVPVGSKLWTLGQMTTTQDGVESIFQLQVTSIPAYIHSGLAAPVGSIPFYYNGITAPGGAARGKLYDVINSGGSYTNPGNRQVITLSVGDLVLFGDNLDIIKQIGSTNNNTPSLPTRTTMQFSSSAGSLGVDQFMNIQLTKGYRLLTVDFSGPARLRVYSSEAYQAADASRVIGVDPVSNHGVMLEFVATSDYLSAPLSPTIDGFDGKNVPDGQIPVTITPLESGNGVVTVTLGYLPTEI